MQDSPTIEAPPSSGERKRPFGIYIIASLQAVNALASGFRAIGIVDTPQMGVLDGATSGTLATLMMIAGLGVAAGLLQLKRWAWVATMIWVGFGMAAELVFYFYAEETNYVLLAISIAQVFYLNLSDVQAAFDRRDQRS